MLPREKIRLEPHQARACLLPEEFDVDDAWNHMKKVRQSIADAQGTYWQLAEADGHVSEQCFEQLIGKIGIALDVHNGLYEEVERQINQYGEASLMIGFYKLLREQH